MNHWAPLGQVRAPGCWGGRGAGPRGAVRGVGNGGPVGTPAVFFLPIPVFFAGVAGRGRSDGAELPRKGKDLISLDELLRNLQLCFLSSKHGIGKSCFALGTVTCCLTATDGFFLSGFCLMLDSHLIKHLRMQIKDANEQTQLLSAAEALSSCGCFPCLWPCSN